MFDPAKFEEMCESDPEIVLYYLIQQIGGFIWRMNHDMADGRIPQASHAEIVADITKAREQQVFAIGKLTRFGLENPIKSEGGLSPEYWQWYRWWNSYAENLSAEDFSELEKALEEKADVSAWRPEGDWKSVVV